MARLSYKHVTRTSPSTKKPSLNTRKKTTSLHVLKPIDYTRPPYMYINQPITPRTSLAIPKPTSQSTEHNQTNPNFLLDRNRLKNSLDCTSGHETALTIPPAYDRVTGRREEPVADWFPTRPESNLSSIDS